MSLKAPTPPTPPTIDTGDLPPSTPRIDAHQFFEVPEMPFRERKEKVVDDTKSPTDEKTAPVTQEKTNPEDMARDAVANGAGPLTKRTVTTRADDEPPPQKDSAPIQTVTTAPPPVATSSDSYERGQAVLQEFREEDSRITETPAPTSTPTAQPESHGGIFWIATLIFVIAATFIVARKFLFRRKPKLRKSDLFESSSEKLKSMSKSPLKTSAPVEPKEKKPPVKPARLPKKADDDKGKRFEVRI